MGNSAASDPTDETGAGRGRRGLRIGLLAVVMSGAIATSAVAQETDIRSLLVQVLEQHDRILAARNQFTAAEEQTSVARGAYFPNLGVTALQGRERRSLPNVERTLENPRELNFTLTQRVYDFGARESQVDTSDLQRDRADMVVNATEQQVLLEALSAYVDLVRARRVLEFARESVDNIKRQAELEDARIVAGAGLSTDVLQAKAQLAGAEARAVTAQGDLVRALNRYTTVFYRDPPSARQMEMPTVSPSVIPSSLSEAMVVARETNPQLRTALIDRRLSDEAITSTRSSLLFPQLDLIGEHKLRRDVEGVAGSRTESIIKLQMSYNWNMGMTALNSIRAAEASSSATGRLYNDAIYLIEEQVRNAWNNLSVTRRNAELLENQADIAREFVELAREERRAGRRSLIDVLSGETVWINAQSDATAARMNVLIATFQLLGAMGQLDVSIVE